MAVSAFHALEAQADALGAPPQLAKAATQAAAVQQFCSIWQKVKPLVAFVGSLPFFAKWTMWITLLASAADAVCAAPPAPPTP